MKLAFVELAGFRGFKDQTRFAFPGGFVVLTGRNGVGKSTVLDAVDFALTGTLNKYAVREAKGGGLDEHLWWVGEGTPAAEYVRIGFVDEGGDEFVITRSRERGLDVPSADIAHRLCMAGSPSNAFPETLLSTTLIRDETIAALSLDLPGQARFKAVRDAIGGLGGPNYANRTAALVVAANKSKTEQEKRIEELKAELGRTLSALTEARSAAERQPDVAEAGRILAALEPAVSADSSDRAEVVRRRVVERKQVLAILGEAVSRLERIHDERVYLASKAGEAEIALARSEFEKARGAREKCEVPSGPFGDAKETE